jgi:hypothetical protein
MESLADFYRRKKTRADDIQKTGSKRALSFNADRAGKTPEASR